MSHIAGMILLTVSLALVGVSTAGAAGIAGPDQIIAQGLPVLLGDPAKSGTDPGDTDPGGNYHWRQIIIDSESYVKLSHIDKTTTMFIAPEVSSDTRFRFGLTRNGVENTVDITVVPLAPDSPSNTTFIDNTISPATCDTYDPATRACGSGSYKAQKSTFRTSFYPNPAPGWRYVWRQGTYSYTKDGSNRCRSTTSPVVRVEGPNAANGTATAPIQFKTYKSGSTYESVLISMGTETDCAIAMIFWVAGSSYVIVEGFELNGTAATGTSGRMLVLGGSGWDTGGPDYTVAPAHHVTIRHVMAHDNGAAANYRGAFAVEGPSHEVALQYFQQYNGGSGIVLGREHEINKAFLPYNFFLHTVSVHDNYKHPGNSIGIEFAGLRNSICYRCVSYRNSDGGMTQQGPYVDSNVYWDSVTFRQDSDLSPLVATLGRGNERGMQLTTINADIGHAPPYPRSGAYNRSYRVAIYDNKGNGYNDSSGGVDNRAYHLTLFNNCLGPSSWAGMGIETHAGDGYYVNSPAPGATVVNTISYHHGYHCNGTQGDIVVVGYAMPYTTLVTNLPAGVPYASPLNQVAAPGFVVTTPALGVLSTLTTDTTMYTNAATRTVNPSFGTTPGLTLQATSIALNAGTFVAGVHCDRADDDASPYPVDDPNCIHWRGQRPDVGAYEYGTGIGVASPPAVPSGLQVLPVH